MTTLRDVWRLIVRVVVRLPDDLAEGLDNLTLRIAHASGQPFPPGVRARQARRQAKREPELRAEWRRLAEDMANDPEHGGLTLEEALRRCRSLFVKRKL